MNTPHPAVWKGQALHHTPGAGISSSFRLLDRELPGNGWPRGTLIELLVNHLGIGEFRFLAPTLRSLTQSGQHVVLLTPPHLPYAQAFDALGVDSSKVVVVNAQTPVDRLWAVEQTMKSNAFGALITWLDDLPAEHPRSHQATSLTRPDRIRRLQLAASRTQGLVFAFRPFAAQHHASPAPLRLALLPRRYPDLAVQVLKRRGPVMSTPIDIAIPVPGTGLRPVEPRDKDQAIVLGTSPHVVDRFRYSRSLSGALSSPTSDLRSTAGQ